MKTPHLPSLLPFALTLIASSRMLSDIVGSTTLHGIGLASGIAPYPKVFTSTNGYEAFSSRFILSATTPDEGPWQSELTASNPHRLQGPYQRRNVYGAALCFSPCLPEPLRSTVLSNALAPSSPIRHELAIPPQAHHLQLRIIPEPGAPFSSWSWPSTTPSPDHPIPEKSR